MHEHNSMAWPGQAIKSAAYDPSNGFCGQLKTGNTNHEPRVSCQPVAERRPIAIAHISFHLIIVSRDFIIYKIDMLENSLKLLYYDFLSLHIS